MGRRARAPRSATAPSRDAAARMERAAGRAARAASAATPGIATSSVPPSASGCGSASSSARVYGWRGASSSSRRRPRLDDAARVEDRDVVGDRREDAEVVRDQDHREPVLPPQAVEQAQDPRLDGHVERRGRFVGDQQLRPAGERDRDRDPLPHAAARTGAGTRAARAPDRGCAPRRAARRPALALPARRRPRGSRTCSVSCLPIESIGCSDVSGSWKTIASSRPRTSRSARGPSASRSRPSYTRRPRRSRAGGQQLQEREHRDRLAAAALARDAEDLPALDRVVDVVDDRDGAARFVGSRTLRPSTSSSARHSLPSARPRRLRVERVAQRVAEEVEREHDREDRQPGKRADPPVLEVLRALGDAGAPLRVRRLRAEAEEREAGEQQHGVAEIERREHEHRPEHVRQHVAHQRLARRRCRAAEPTARTPSGRPRGRARARLARTTAS